MPAQKGLTLKQITYLRELGLSKESIKLYELLLQKGRLSAQQAAHFTGDHPSAEYRLFYGLEAKDLIRRYPGRPRHFEALPLLEGLSAAYIDTQTDLKMLLRAAASGSTNPAEQVRIIIGRQAVYDLYIKMAPEAKREICLYSIGIAYSQALTDI